jgi:hypothetical protein
VQKDKREQDESKKLTSNNTQDAKKGDFGGVVEKGGDQGLL